MPSANKIGRLEQSFSLVLAKLKYNLLVLFYMYNNDLQHTLNIFQKMHDMLPPLVPAKVAENLAIALQETQENKDISLEELEDVMIEHGKRMWPYMRAFDDIYKTYESHLGNKLLLQRVSHGMKKKVDVLTQMGGSFHDMLSGSTHDMFDDDERVELTAHLIDLKQDIRKHATQAILSHDKDRYEEKVEHYGKMVEEINELLEDMRQFAHEEAHERVVEDIHSHARAIDLQFAHLAPRVDIVEVRRLPEYYRGKHAERLFH